MPRLEATELERIAAELLVAAGASDEEAAIVARHSVGANLTGHDSHGIIQIPTYIDRIGKGHIVPGAPIEVVSESPTTTVIDGHLEPLPAISLTQPHWTSRNIVDLFC